MARILIAEDLAFMRMLQKEILEPAGHEVVGEASNGVEVVEKYKKLWPDVVIMDITMPEMNGLEATKRILSIDPNARIVICSALGQEKMIIDAIQLGVKDFVVKPFKPERLLSAIEKALR